MKFIIQLLALFAFAFCATSTYANDGTPPPGSPAGAPAQPPAPPTEPTTPPAPAEDKAAPPKATRRKKEVEDANKEAEAPDEPDAWEPLTKGTHALQIPGIGTIVRNFGEGLVFLPGIKVRDGSLVSIH